LSLARNLTSLITAELVAKLATFVAMAYLARVARDPACRSLLVSRVVSLRFIFAALACAAIVILAAVLDRPTAQTRLLWSYGGAVLFMPLLLQWVFQGHDWMGRAALVQVVRQAVFAAGVLLLVQSADTAWRTGVAEAAGVTAAAIYSLWGYRRWFADRWHWRIDLPRTLLRDGLTIGLSQMCWSAKMFGATVLIGLMATPSDVGLFGSAMRLLIAAHAFVWLYFFNISPTLSRLWWNERLGFRLFYRTSSARVAVAAILGGAGWVALAPWVVRIVYGTEFERATVPLRWLAGVCLMAALSGHARFGLIAAGRQADELFSSATGMIVAWIALPIGYWQGGPAGAAIGLVCAEAATWLVAWAFARRLLAAGAPVGGALPTTERGGPPALK
jgi:O-antigen/teichoic acid export membrane protein